MSASAFATSAHNSSVNYARRLANGPVAALPKKEAQNGWIVFRVNNVIIPTPATTPAVQHVDTDTGNHVSTPTSVTTGNDSIIMDSVTFTPDVSEHEMLRRQSFPGLLSSDVLMSNQDNSLSIVARHKFRPWSASVTSYDPFLKDQAGDETETITSFGATSGTALPCSQAATSSDPSSKEQAGGEIKKNNPIALSSAESTNGDTSLITKKPPRRGFEPYTHPNAKTCGNSVASDPLEACESVADVAQHAEPVKNRKLRGCTRGRRKDKKTKVSLATDGLVELAATIPADVASSGSEHSPENSTDDSRDESPHSSTSPTTVLSSIHEAESSQLSSVMQHIEELREEINLLVQDRRHKSNAIRALKAVMATQRKDSEDRIEALMNEHDRQLEQLRGETNDLKTHNADQLKQHQNEIATLKEKAELDLGMERTERAEVMALNQQLQNEITGMKSKNKLLKKDVRQQKNHFQGFQNENRNKDESIQKLTGDQKEKNEKIANISVLLNDSNAQLAGSKVKLGNVQQELLTAQTDLRRTVSDKNELARKSAEDLKLKDATINGLTSQLEGGAIPLILKKVELSDMELKFVAVQNDLKLAVRDKDELVQKMLEDHKDMDEKMSTTARQLNDTTTQLNTTRDELANTLQQLENANTVIVDNETKAANRLCFAFFLLILLVIFFNWLG
ncbi:hypothetical protein EJ08DRAFT_677465 [Tothia fuscella]|uniref:Uncharacterized protein n=1 Tax=Tothia fuscella TaxID=1048955 RepID=A0A9P4NVR1_9PEZI|nr:hypothetical protein EJ08DRAFT_677465 [Tothia fuscella]